jgi:hypothetical protein
MPRSAKSRDSTSRGRQIACNVWERGATSFGQRCRTTIAKARVGGRAPNQASAHSSEQLQPVLAVGQRRPTCGIGANKVALDDAARETEALERIEENPVLTVPRD